MRLLQELYRAFPLLGNARIEHVVPKTWVLAEITFDHIALGMTRDLDLLVRGKEVQGALQVLRMG